MDVHNAFLHGDLSEEVYMRLPPGFYKGRPGLVCKLNKSPYGLTQAPQCWFSKLATALKRYGFTQSYSDYSLFTLCKGQMRLHVLVYVDDLIISGNESTAIFTFKQYLSSCFHMKDLGVLKYFLGVEFLHEPRQDHWSAALRVVKYLKGSPGQGILLSVDCDLKLSEYRSMAVVTCELKWLKGLLACFGVDHTGSMELFCDSQSALHLAHNPVFHERTKHIEIDCHFLLDAVLAGVIRMSHVSTTNQLSDIFTKALGRRQFEFLLRKLDILDLHGST
ncbi:transmembrane signal receptor [Lithospermum erythrorhizon]|uniref:Transmembrane signal receptor n=1 Tax=Lithospermum erythrorhizon TaxID=34254 RepID=A0AAV3P1I8_LITER